MGTQWRWWRVSGGREGEREWGRGREKERGSERVRGGGSRKTVRRRHVEYNSRVVESYTQRDVRLHVQRLKDLLSTNPLQHSMLNSDGVTLSFLSAITSLEHEGTSLTSLPLSMLFLPTDVGLRGAEDSSPLDPPGYCMPHFSAPSSGESHAPDLPLSVFYPSNLSKHFKVRSYYYNHAPLSCDHAPSTLVSRVPQVS